MNSPNVNVERGITGDYIVESVQGASTTAPALLASSTRPAARPFGRFGAFVMPVFAAVAFAAPVPDERIRTIFSRASRSRSAIGDVAWLVDSWSYSIDAASVEQIRMLDELLMLDTSEGFTLELPE